ncbi:SIS domain-containing protein, partial [Candidatus Neomarinimicrobiota bacterium]
ELVRQSRFPLVVPSADEQSVVMTRSFTSMLLLIQYVAAIRSGDHGLEEALEKVPGHGERVVEQAKAVVEKIIGTGSYTKFVFLGHGPYYGLASEAMLKMTEMSLSVSEAYHSMEFRHGPMSIVNEDMLLTMLISERAREQETKLLKEMKALGATTWVICERADGEIRAASDYLLELGTQLSDEARLILYMPPLQLLAYTNAVAKGLDPDNPKNLTQVVTLT